ncbi:MAG: hypothetical protein WAK60_04720 [Sedimentisphaerales bacterium]
MLPSGCGCVNPAQRATEPQDVSSRYPLSFSRRRHGDVAPLQSHDSYGVVIFTPPNPKAPRFIRWVIFCSVRFDLLY